MKETNGKIPVIVADNQYLTSVALAQLVKENYQYFFAGAATHQYGLEKLLEKCNMAFVLTDFENFWDNHIGHLQNFLEKFPLITVLIIVNSVEKPVLQSLIDAGIQNIIYKNACREEILAAMDASLKGKKYFAPEILDILLTEIPEKNKTPETGNLTTTEIEIVKLIASGLTTKEIAVQKNISIHTVMSHRKNIFRKMGINSASELIMHAVKAGWIDNIEYYI